MFCNSPLSRLLAETEDTLQILTGTKRVLVFSPDFGKTWRRVATDTTSQVC